MLTDTAIKNIKAQDKAVKYFDAGGLFLFVPKTGKKLWRFRYFFEGKEKLLSLGEYPYITLKLAREMREAAKGQLAIGIDPSNHKKAIKTAIISTQNNSFEIIAREWFNHNKHSWAEAHAKKILAMLEKNAFPLIGGKDMATLTAQELSTVLDHIEARGALETAHRLLQICSQISRYAIVKGGRAEYNIAENLKGSLKKVIKGNFASLKEPSAIGGLLLNIDSYEGSFIVKTALQIAPYVFVRPSELRQAPWSEFNLDEAEWRIPAERMKMKQVHIVPLAKQVVELLRGLQPFTEHTGLLFPSPRANTRPISDVTLLASLRRMGYSKEEMTVHGFRSMASTLLNEQGYNSDHIERQLAHGGGNRIRAVYNYAQYLPERKKMMQEWADYLDSLKA